MATMDMRIKTKAARKSFQESVPSASTSLKTSKPVLVKPTRKRAQESKIVTVDTSKMGDAAEEIADQPQITRNLKEFDMFAAKDDLSKKKHAAQQKEKVGSEENTIQTVQELSEQMSSPMEKDPSESVINCKDKPSTNKRNETSNHREISDPSPSCVQLQTQQSVDKLNNAKARKPQKRRNSYGKPRKRQQAKKSKTAVFGVSELAGETWEINMHPATPQSKLSYSQVQGQISFTRMSEQGKVEPKRDPNKLPTTILSTPSSSIYTHPTASFHFGEESFTGFTPSDSELDDREMPASLKITLKRSRPSQAEPAENLRDTATTYVSETGRPLRRCRQRSLGYVEQSEVVDQEVPSEPFSAEINVAQPDNMLSPNAVLPESNGLVSIIKTVGNSTHETGEPEISNTVQSENLEASNQALGLIGEQQPWAEEMKENSTDVKGKAQETSKETPEEILGLYESGTAGSPVKAVECEAQNSGLTSVAEQVSLTQGECLPEQIVALMELESAGCEVCLGDSTTDELEEQGRVPQYESNLYILEKASGDVYLMENGVKGTGSIILYASADTISQVTETILKSKLGGRELKLVHRGVNTETVGSTDQTKACQELEDREDHHVESAQIHDPVSAAESSKISEATEKFEVEKLPPEIDESHQSNKTSDLCKEDKAETDVTNAQVMDGEFYLEPKQVETPEQAPVEVFGDKADVEEHSNEEQRDLYDKVDHNDNTTNEKSITTETDIDTKLEENKKVEMKQKRKLQARKSIVKDNESMCPKATVMLKRKLIERTIKAQESLMSFRSKRAKQLKMMAEMYGMAKMTKANQVESPQEQVVEPRNINEIQSQGEDAEKKTDALKQTDGHKQDAGTPTESELVSLKAETKLPAADAPTLETWTEEAIRLGLFQPDESLGRMHKFYQLKEDPDEEGIDLASTDGDLEVNKKRSPEEESVNVHQKYIGVLERSLKQQRKQIAATRKTLKEQMQISETLISKYRGAVDFLVEKLLHEQLVLPVSSTPIDAIIEASKKRLIRKIQAS